MLSRYGSQSSIGSKASITLGNEPTAQYGNHIKAVISDEFEHGGIYYVPFEKLTDGKTYTWSVYVKASSNKTGVLIGSEQGGWISNQTLTTEWKKYTHTFTAKTDENGYYSFVVYLNGDDKWNTGDELYIHSLELMEGTPTNTTQEYKAGDEYGTLPVLTRAGYNFDGWYTEPVGGTKVEETSIMPDRDITLYGRWRNYQHTVAYDANGGTGAPEPQIKSYGTSFYISSVKPVREGYTFKNWNTKADGTGTSYDSGAYYSRDQNGGTVTLYAQWEQTTFKITYNLDGGTDPGNPKEYTAKTNDFTLKNPTKTGYTFNGWVESQDGLSSQAVIINMNGNVSMTESNGVYTMTQNISGNEFNSVKIQLWDLNLNYITNITHHTTPGTYNVAYTSSLETGTYYISISANGTTRDSQRLCYRVNLEKGRTYNVGFTIDSFSSTKAVVSKFKFYRQGGNVTSIPVNIIQKGDTGNKTFTANWTINNYYIDLNTYLDGTWYEGSRVKVNLTVGGSNKGYVSDYYTAHPYGTAWSINGVQIDGTNVAYTASGTVGTSSVIIRIDFYTLTIARNNTSYGTTSASSLIALSGTTYSTSGSTLTMSDGRRVTASPTAATGYTTSFSSWSPSSATMNTTRTVTANFSRVINSYYVDLNLFLDGASYGSSSRVTANLTVGGSNKGYVSDYYTTHPYGTSWSINGVRVDGTTIPYSRSGTVGTSTVNIRIDFYTLTIARNSTSYGTVSASSLITLSGTSYSTSGSTLRMSDGRTVTASPTSATGYSTSFSSWSPSSATMNTTRTVTANFSRTGNTYYVAYNGNGATGGSTATSTHRYGTASALRANGFVKNYTMSYGSKTLRWTFKNWNRNSAGTSTSYSNGQSVTNLATSGTVTLYAQWTLNKTGKVTATGNSLNIRKGPGAGYSNIGVNYDGYNRFAKTNATATITNCAYVNYGSSGVLWVYITVPTVYTKNNVDYEDGKRSGGVSSENINLN